METKQKKPMSVKLNRFLTYLRRVMIWLLDGGFYILSSISVITTILYITKILNFFPNVIASVLSILGLVIILSLQIFDAIDFAEHRPNTFINWIKSFPTLKTKTITLGSVMEISSALKAHATLHPRSDAIIEEKVAFLLRQIDSIQEILNKMDDKLDNVNSAANKRIDEVKSDLKQLSTTLGAELAEHIVGSYDANIFGVIITICGIVIQVFRG